MSEQTSSPPENAAPAANQEQPSAAPEQGLTGTDPSVPVPAPPAPPVPAEADASATNTPETSSANTSTTASANSTTADLSNLTQTITNASGTSASKSLEPSAAESSPAKSVSAKSHKSSTSHKTHTSPANGGQTRATSSHRRKRQKLGELDLSTAKIGFIGAGKMAESTINGLIHYGEYLINSLELFLSGCQASYPLGTSSSPATANELLFDDQFD